MSLGSFSAPENEQNYLQGTLQKRGEREIPLIHGHVGYHLTIHGIDTLARDVAKKTGI